MVWPCFDLYKVGRAFLFSRGLCMEYKKNKKCTIKERKRAARILAARQDLDRLNDDIIQTVANMSDSDILKFLDEDAAQAVEALPPESVEEIKPGAGADYEKIYPLLVDVANNYILSNNWDGEKITPLQWGSVCLHVGMFARSRSFFRGSDDIKNFYGNKDKSVNAQAVAGAVPVWLNLCYKYNKPPLMCDFCYFCGISQEWLLSGVNSECIQLHKTLERIQADGLRARALNGKESPIGAIFLLKADHGLVEAQTVRHEYIKSNETAAALPVFGDLPGLDDKNGI